MKKWIFRVIPIILCILFIIPQPMHTYAAPLFNESNGGDESRYLQWTEYPKHRNEAKDEDFSVNPNDEGGDKPKGNPLSKAIIAVIWVAGDCLHNILNGLDDKNDGRDNKGLKLTIDAIVLGEMSTDADKDYFSFTLSKGNAYGIAGATFYVAVRNICFALLYIMFLWDLFRCTLATDYRVIASFKQNIYAYIIAFLLIYLMPQIVNWVIVLRMNVINYIAELLNDSGMTIGEVTNSISKLYSKEYTEDSTASIWAAVLYIAIQWLAIKWTGGYITIALTETILFAIAPIVIMVAVKDKGLLNRWCGIFFSNLFVPAVDYMLLLVVLIYKKVLGEAEIGFLQGLLMLFLLYNIPLARNAIVGLFGGGTFGGVGFAEAISSSAKSAAGAITGTVAEAMSKGGTKDTDTNSDTNTDPELAEDDDKFLNTAAEQQHKNMSNVEDLLNQSGDTKSGSAVDNLINGNNEENTATSTENESFTKENEPDTTREHTFEDNYGKNNLSDSGGRAAEFEPVFKGEPVKPENDTNAEEITGDGVEVKATASADANVEQDNAVDVSESTPEARQPLPDNFSQTRMDNLELLDRANSRVQTLSEDISSYDEAIEKAEASNRAEEENIAALDEKQENLGDNIRNYERSLKNSSDDGTRQAFEDYQQANTDYESATQREDYFANKIEQAQLQQQAILSSNGVTSEKELNDDARRQYNEAEKTKTESMKSHSTARADKLDAENRRNNALRHNSNIQTLDSMKQDKKALDANIENRKASMATAPVRVVDKNGNVETMTLAQAKSNRATKQNQLNSAKEAVKAAQSVEQNLATASGRVGGSREVYNSSADMQMALKNNENHKKTIDYRNFDKNGNSQYLTEQEKADYARQRAGMEAKTRRVESFSKIGKTTGTVVGTVAGAAVGGLVGGVTLNPNLGASVGKGISKASEKTGEYIGNRAGGGRKLSKQEKQFTSSANERKYNQDRESIAYVDDMYKAQKEEQQKSKKSEKEQKQRDRQNRAETRRARFSDSEEKNSTISENNEGDNE